VRSANFNLSLILTAIFSIHPRDKQTVADRLANAAKNLLYGENVKSNGPLVSVDFRRARNKPLIDVKYVSQPVAIAEDSPGQIKITYDTNIRIGGPNGFAVNTNIINGGLLKSSFIIVQFSVFKERQHVARCCD
jgi:hypothetical protein